MSFLDSKFTATHVINFRIDCNFNRRYSVDVADKIKNIVNELVNYEQSYMVCYRVDTITNINNVNKNSVWFSQDINLYAMTTVGYGDVRKLCYDVNFVLSNLIHKGVRDVVRKIRDIFTVSFKYVGVVTSYRLPSLSLELFNTNPSSSDSSILSSDILSSSSSDEQVDNVQLVDNTKSVDDTKSVAKAISFSDLECVICLEQSPSCVFGPCGHLKCCEQCSNGLTECPICRTTITSKMRVFV